MMWSGIPSDQIDIYWPDIEPMFGDAFERSPDWFTPEYVLNELKAARYQLWFTHDGEKPSIALITEIVKPVCRLQLLGGRNFRDSCDVLTEVIAPWALANGCDSMTCFPRDGLAKLLKRDFGFQFVKETDQGKLYFKDLVNNEARVQ